MTDNLGAGLIGFLVVLALAIGTFFLLRSMAKHLRRVPPSFEEQPRPDEEKTPPV